LFFIQWNVYYLLKCFNLKPFRQSIAQKVSVLVAVRNEEMHIKSFIFQMLQQSYSNFELILINDHSTDETKNIITSFNDYRIKCYDLPAHLIGKKNAIKYGLSLCNTDWVIFTDADVELKNDWLVSYINYLDNEVMVIAPVQLKIEKHRFGDVFQQLDFAAMQFITMASTIARKAFMCNGANMALHKNRALNYIQTLNMAIPSGDDVFILHQHIQQGGKVYLNISPSSVVSIKPAATFKEFVLQRLRWASKAKYYKNSRAVFISWFIFIIHFYLFVGLIASIVYHALLPWIALFLIIKMLIDFPLFWVGQRLISMYRQWYAFYPFVSLIYFLYISTIAIVATFSPVVWKNRKW